MIISTWVGYHFKSTKTIRMMTSTWFGHRIMTWFGHHLGFPNIDCNVDQNSHLRAGRVFTDNRDDQGGDCDHPRAI